MVCTLKYFGDNAMICCKETKYTLKHFLLLMMYFAFLISLLRFEVRFLIFFSVQLNQLFVSVPRLAVNVDSF